MVERHIRNFLMAALCSLVLVFLPVTPVFAQDDDNVLEKIGKGAKKGGEVVVDKAEDVGEFVGDKAEDVGEGAKDLFTDDDPDSNNDEGLTTTPAERSLSEDSDSTAISDEETSDQELPATGGALPLLALAGMAALAGARGLHIRRQ